MATYKGLDISWYQPPNALNWASLKSEGIEFVIIKYTEGTSYKNSYRVAQLNGARAAGIYTHAYHYFVATSDAAAVAEAEWFVTVVKDNPVDGYLFLDVEDSVLGYNPDVNTRRINLFLNRLAELGYTKVGVYANLNWWRNYIHRSQVRSGALVWLAQWASSHSDPCDIWQYTSSANFSGYNGNLDANIAYTSVMVKESQPSTPTEPEEPSEPEEPTTPTEPEKPSEPSEPSESENPYPEPTETKGFFARGDEVKWIQTQLIAKGYTVSVSGFYFINTWIAVRRFQRDNNLTVTGKVDNSTLEALK